MYYSKLKILRHPEKLEALEEGRISAPIHIRIKPTNVCNHNCSYCSYQNSYGQLGKDMKVQDSIPLEKMNEIIDDCGDMGVRAITFSGGGEPLLYKGLMSILEKCSEKGISTAILTNGIYLKKAMLMVAMDYCSWIRISMDGWDRDSYSEYRKCPHEDFDQLLENIKNSSKIQSNCILGVNIIIDEKNCTHLYDMVKMVYDIGVRSIKISPCIISNDIEKNNELHYKIEPFVNDEIAKIIESGMEIYNSYHAQLEGFQKGYRWCPYIQILPIIGADQNVYACHDKAYNKTNGMIGSIRDQSFKKFWNDGADKFFKIDPSRDCNHHCVTDKTNKMIFEYLSIEHEEFC